MFLATRHINNVFGNSSDIELKHNGGSPGFILAYEENGSTYIVIPDFSGNRFYESLGNIENERVAGVVFPCFATGDMLHVTGIAENIYDDEAERIMPRVTMVTRNKLVGHVWIKEALNFKLLGPEKYSPYNPSIRYLAMKLEKMENPAKEYRHMGNSKPKPINDDYARTWSISSSPPFDPNTNTFQAKNKVSYTLKHQRHGVISSLLHSRSVDQQPPLRTKFFGVGGEFTCFDESNQTSQKLLFLADGIGFTPFLAMFEALTQTKQKVDIAVLFAGRGDEIDLLKHLISADIVSPMSNIPTTGSRRILQKICGKVAISCRKTWKITGTWKQYSGQKYGRTFPVDSCQAPVLSARN
ncbi:unnamed protein product [Rotaria socialis]|uniref:FAD-binding FR-type domain-containing protein n=2 Tax=Rotaria socialis TaxID=392032 RepID=A0A820CIK9_9BILA|nr:unnamed protein product [Rotaria socialis]CAF4209039.1 unnamed protein product [Rotaria socialis]CAF4852062.1 unnamed protein product [Rotaria socialis]